MRLTTTALGMLGVAGLIGCRSAGDGDAPAAPYKSVAGREHRLDVATAPRAASMVRFVNAMPGTRRLSLTSDTVAVFSNVGFGEVTPYRTLRDTNTIISLDTVRAFTNLANEAGFGLDGGRFTILALPDGEGDLALRVIRDEVAPSPSSRVRFLHAAVGFDDINIMMRGRRDPLFDDVDYGAEAGFEDVASGRTGFSLRRNAQDLGVAGIGTMSLRPGTSYTIVLVASPGGKVQALTLVDDSVTSANIADVGGR